MILLGLVLMTFAFLLGYSIGLQQAKKQKDVGYQQAVDQVKEKLSKTGLMPPTMETNVINGAVASVGEDSLEMDAVQLVTNPLEEPAPIKRRIEINAGTKIVKSVPLTLEEMDSQMKQFEAAQQKFDQAIRAGKEAEPPSPPASATLQEIALSDIKVGDQVRVASADNITFAEKFMATEITVYATFEPPPAEEPVEVPAP